MKAIFVSAFCVLVAFAQAPPFNDVRDVYLSLPHAIAGSQEARNDILGFSYVVVDIANGYLSCDAPDNPFEDFELAIFRKTDGGFIAAWADHTDDPEVEGPQPTKAFLLFDYRDGQWVDVTRQLLPVSFNKSLDWRLPRKGKDILVKNRQEQLVHRLRWTGAKFIRIVPSNPPRPSK